MLSRIDEPYDNIPELISKGQAKMYINTPGFKQRIEPEGMMLSVSRVNTPIGAEYSLTFAGPEEWEYLKSVFKTSLYYMLKIKSGSVKAKLPKECTLTLMASQYHPVQEKRNGFTKIHVVPDSDEQEIVSVMNYFQFVFKKQ